MNFKVTDYFHEIVAGLMLVFMLWHLRVPFILSNLHHTIEKLNDWLSRESKRLDLFEAEHHKINDKIGEHHTRISVLETKGEDGHSRSNSERSKTNH